MTSSIPMTSTYHAPITTANDLYGDRFYLPSAMVNWAMRHMDHEALIQYAAEQQHLRLFKRVERDLVYAVQRRANRIAETARVVAVAKAQLAKKEEAAAAAKAAAEAAAAAIVRAHSRPPIFFCADLMGILTDFNVGDTTGWKRRFTTVLDNINALPIGGGGLVEIRRWTQQIQSKVPLVEGTLARRYKRQVALEKQNVWGSPTRASMFDWNKHFDVPLYLGHMYEMRAHNTLPEPDYDAKGKLIRAERHARTLPGLKLKVHTLKQRLQRHITENGGTYKKSWSVGQLEDEILHGI